MPAPAHRFRAGVATSCVVKRGWAALASEGQVQEERGRQAGGKERDRERKSGRERHTDRDTKDRVASRPGLRLSFSEFIHSHLARKGHLRSKLRILSGHVSAGRVFCAPASRFCKRMVNALLHNVGYHDVPVAHARAKGACRRRNMSCMLEENEPMAAQLLHLGQ